MITTSKSTTAGTLALGQQRKRTVNDPTFSTAHEVAAAIRERRVSAVEVVDAYLARIARHNPALNAIVTLNEEEALARAREADTALARGEVWGPLHGVPVTIKDSFATAGLRTTSGFAPLANYIPAVDATVVARLRAAGAIVLGKTNLPMLVHGFQSDNAIFGRSNNPWDLERHRAGQLAAVPPPSRPVCRRWKWAATTAARCEFRRTTAVCIHSNPPSTASRPSVTFRILPGQSRGVRHVATPGPLARSVQDLALALQVIAGPDPRQPEVPLCPLFQQCHGLGTHCVWLGPMILAGCR